MIFLTMRLRYIQRRYPCAARASLGIDALRATTDWRTMLSTGRGLQDRREFRRCRGRHARLPPREDGAEPPPSNTRAELRELQPLRLRPCVGVTTKARIVATSRPSTPSGSAGNQSTTRSASPRKQRLWVGDRDLHKRDGDLFKLIGPKSSKIVSVEIEVGLSASLPQAGRVAPAAGGSRFAGSRVFRVERDSVECAPVLKRLLTAL